MCAYEHVPQLDRGAAECTKCLNEFIEEGKKGETFTASCTLCSRDIKGADDNDERKKQKLILSGKEKFEDTVLSCSKRVLHKVKKTIFLSKGEQNYRHMLYSFVPKPKQQHPPPKATTTMGS